MVLPSYKRLIAGHKSAKKRNSALKNNPKTYDIGFIRESYHSRCIQALEASKKPLSKDLKKKIYNDVVCAFY